MKSGSVPHVQLRFIYIHLSLCATTISNGAIVNGPRGNSFWQYAHKLLPTGIYLNLAIMKDSLLCQILVKECCHWFTDLPVLDGYVLHLLFLVPFVPLPSALIEYVTDAWDLQFLNFPIWICIITSISAPATEWRKRFKYLRPLKLHFTKDVALTVRRLFSGWVFPAATYIFFLNITDGERTRAVRLLNKPKAFFFDGFSVQKIRKRFW